MLAVNVSVTNVDGSPGVGLFSCTLFARGDPDGTHATELLNSEGAAALLLLIVWTFGTEVALLCFYELLSAIAELVTIFFVG